ncbi:hypothetical protein [Paeniglutamicibacter antarcticus]|uniref:Uncharacterized protein n=1 Tax=Paeniglutamicibacter antarcticus TaxID=494023 RepID=A0ABP9TKC0_9MICC
MTNAETSWTPPESDDLMDATRQCTAKAKQSGNRCKRVPAKGATVCNIHGAKAPSVAAKAAERVQQDAARRALKALGEPTPIDPAQALLKLIAWKHGEVQWLRGKVQELEPAHLAWGTIEHREGVGPEGPISVSTEKALPSVWWSLLRQAEDQLAEYASKALRAGVEERRLRMAEADGALVAMVVRRILDRLNLTTEQAALTGQIVPEEMRRLAGDAA